MMLVVVRAASDRQWHKPFTGALCKPIVHLVDSVQPVKEENLNFQINSRWTRWCFGYICWHLLGTSHRQCQIVTISYS